MQNNNVVIASQHWQQENPSNYYDQKSYQQLNAYYEKDSDILWMYMQPKPRQCFTETLLNELINCGNTFETNKIKYAVLASSNEKFNLGGDLELFENCIRSKDIDTLREYAYLCIKATYTNHNISTISNTTSISLIQGDALGGGFEAALSSDVIIAEKGVHFGLPEVLFNMFPGMGAYSFLSRKIGPVKTREMITSGKFYSAEELYDMGIIDILAESGQGDIAVYDYINKEERSKNTFDALKKVSKLNNPVSYDELKNIVDIWVDSAMQLKPRDLKMMHRIVGKQNKK